ncbi:hypothetical protein ACP70R_036138 [Stipagrostis hirtigluma subsp. patula]
MAKIQPLPAASPSPSTAADESQSLQQQAVYTVWMKSLVFNGNGCTVYGADGRVAFRVDNYGCRGGREVFFMDHAGNTLIRIQRKSFGVFKRWEALPVRRRRRGPRGGDGEAVVQGEEGREERRRRDDARRREDVRDRRLRAQIGLQNQRRRRRGGGGDRAEADGGRGCPRRGCPDADSGPGGGSSAGPWFGGRAWPHESLHVMPAIKDS